MKVTTATADLCYCAVVNIRPAYVLFGVIMLFCARRKHPPEDFLSYGLAYNFNTNTFFLARVPWLFHNECVSCLTTKGQVAH